VTLMTRKEVVKSEASEAEACRPLAAHRSKRTSGPPIRIPAANAMKRHEHPVTINKPSVAGCLPTCLPTSPCYSG
jgi:hypothetical protein